MNCVFFTTADGSGSQLEQVGVHWISAVMDELAAGGIRLATFRGKKKLHPVPRRARHKKKKHEQHPATCRDPFPDLLFTLTGACRSAVLEILVSEEARSGALNAHTIYSVISNPCLIMSRVYSPERWNTEPQICCRAREERRAAKRNKQSEMHWK